MNTLDKKPGQVGSEDESEFWSQRPPDILLNRSEGTSGSSTRVYLLFVNSFRKPAATNSHIKNMPRPGQQAARRKRARVSTTPVPLTNQEEPGSPNPRARCLPVADLPADFEGIPEDGAQYLAMVMRANEELPWSTRMEGWTPTVEDETKVRPDNGQPAGTRHMALPQGSWEVLFPLHFQNYRKVGGVSQFPISA